MEDGPQDTTGRLGQVTRRQFTGAVGLGLTAVGTSFAVAGCGSGARTTPPRPAGAPRGAPPTTPPLPPPEGPLLDPFTGEPVKADRKSTRLNSRHVENSYAVFCLEN